MFQTLAESLQKSKKKKVARRKKEATQYLMNPKMVGKKNS